MSGAAAKGEVFVSQTSCASNGSLDCLYDLAVDDILSAQNAATSIINEDPKAALGMTWTPTVDGVQLTGQVFDLLIINRL